VELAQSELKPLNRLLAGQTVDGKSRMFLAKCGAIILWRLLGNAFASLNFSLEHLV
jgi:hypothetical protein